MLNQYSALFAITLHSLLGQQIPHGSQERRRFRPCGDVPGHHRQFISFRDEHPRSIRPPSESMGNRLPFSGRIVLLQEKPTVLTIHPDKELGRPVPGQSGLNIDQFTVRQSFIITATVQLPVGPLPKFCSALEHLFETSVLVTRNGRMTTRVYTTNSRLSKLCRWLNRFISSADEATYEQPR